MKKERETICWDCQNFSTCEWSNKGERVDGWVAVPTVVHEKGNWRNKAYDSYLVLACPKFKADSRVQIYIDELLKLLGIDYTAYKYIVETGKWNLLERIAKKQGYKLLISYVSEDSDQTGRNRYYIKKI